MGKFVSMWSVICGVHLKEKNILSRNHVPSNLLAAPHATLKFVLIMTDGSPP